MRLAIEAIDRMLAHSYDMSRFFMKKALAIFGVGDDIAAVRHDLPHMPSLGVSSLDSRPPWRHGGLLFCRDFRGTVTVQSGRNGSFLTGPGLFAPARSFTRCRARQMTPRPMRSPNKVPFPLTGGDGDVPPIRDSKRHVDAAFGWVSLYADAPHLSLSDCGLRSN